MYKNNKNRRAAIRYIFYNILGRKEKPCCSLHPSSAQHIFSVVIDGVDTTKTELPFSKARYGTTLKAWHLRVHLVGVLIHERHPICFLDCHQFPHDSNLLINTLLQVSYVMVFLHLLIRFCRGRSQINIKTL